MERQTLTISRPYRLLVTTVMVVISACAVKLSPIQKEVAGDEWVRVHVCQMSFLIPKDLKRTQANGVDSCIAEFANERMRLYLDYGRYTGPIERRPRDFDFKEQSQTIGGKTGRVTTFNDDTSFQGKTPYLKYFAHLFVIAKPGENGFEGLPVSLSMTVGGLTEADEEIGKRIFRSISFDEKR